MKQSIISALAFCVSSVFADVPEGVLMSGTAELTVPGYTLEETLDNFPVLVRIPSVITLSCGAEGQYMRFYSEDGSKELAFEIDTWNHGYESLVWVKLPSLAKGTKFLLKYGENFSARTTCDVDVWSSYTGVWHLNEQVSNGGEQTKDSAGNFGLGKTSGSRVETYDGIVGKSFTACDAATWSVQNGSKLTIENPNRKLNSASGFTVSWWAGSFAPGKIAETTNDDKGYVMSHNTWSIFLDNGGEEGCRFNFMTKAGSVSKTMTIADAESDFNTSDWMFTACSVAPGAESATGRIYANAVLKAEDTSFQLADSNDKSFVVGNGSGSKFYPGRIDELRVRNVASSPAWLKAEYEAIHNPSFVEIESEATTTFYVVPAGTEGNSPCVPYSTWASAANSIADVLDKLPDTDSSITIRVAPGVYYPLGRCTIGIPNLTIVSDDGTGKTSCATTIFDGGYPERTDRIFSVTAPNVVIKGFTFRNSRAEGDNVGGAIYANGDGTGLTFSECFFTNCIAYQGGAIYLKASNVKTTIESCRFEDCHAMVVDSGKVGFRNGGGVYIYSGSNGISISNCTFKACSALSGAGVYLPSPSDALGFEKSTYPVISECSFVENFLLRIDVTASGSGGGIFGRAYVENCRFDANFSSGSGSFNPAIGFGYNSIITNCVFENHQSATRGAIGQHKAGVYETKIMDCVFRGNTCQLFGQVAITVDRCVFTNNSISAAIFWGDSSRNSIVRNCLYAYNHQPLRPAAARFENCTVVSNACGVFIDTGNKGSVFVNCYIGGNTNTSNRLSEYRGNANFGYYASDWNGDSLAAEFYATNCVIEGGHSLEKRVVTQPSFDLFECPQAENCRAVTDLVEQKGPGFIDPANGNWRLSRKSPLRDAGIHRSWMDSSSRDLDGNARNIDRYGKEFSAIALPDIGCYECDIPLAAGMRLFVR